MDNNIVNQLEKIKQKILNEIDIKAIYLFGSYAYGVPREDSDFDLYIVIPDNGLRPIEAAKIVNNVIYEDQRKSIDILVGRYSDFQKRRLLPTIERIVARDGVLLYG